MKKVLQPLFLAVLAVPSFVFAAENVPAQAAVAPQNTTVISPRTGIRYTLGNMGSRKVILQTEAIAPANATNINRIVAANPALSTKSQEKAKVALIGEAAVAGTSAIAANNVVHASVNPTAIN